MRPAVAKLAAVESILRVIGHLNGIEQGPASAAHLPAEAAIIANHVVIGRKSCGTELESVEDGRLVPVNVIKPLSRRPGYQGAGLVVAAVTAWVCGVTCPLGAFAIAYQCLGESDRVGSAVGNMLDAVALADRENAREPVGTSTIGPPP